MSAVGKRWKNCGMNVRYLPPLPEYGNIFSSLFDFSVVCPNNITFNQGLCFYVNLFRCLLCATWYKDDWERCLPFSSSQYTGRAKFKWLDKPVLIFSGQGIKAIYLPDGAGPVCTEEVILSHLFCYKSNRFGKGLVLLRDWWIGYDRSIGCTSGEGTENETRNKSWAYFERQRQTSLDMYDG